jgi:hypothetical protein
MVPFLVAVAWPAFTTGIGLLTVGTLIQDKVAHSTPILVSLEKPMLATKTEIADVLLDGMAQAVEAQESEWVDRRNMVREATYPEGRAAEYRSHWGIEKGVEERVLAKSKARAKRRGIDLSEAEVS